MLIIITKWPNFQSDWTKEFSMNRFRYSVCLNFSAHLYVLTGFVIFIGRFVLAVSKTKHISLWSANYILTKWMSFLNKLTNFFTLFDVTKMFLHRSVCTYEASFCKMKISSAHRTYLNVKNLIKSTWIVTFWMN